MTVRPIDQLSAGKSFFSAMGLDVRHFAAIWHIYKIGQLMTTDLNDLCGGHGTSLADFHVLCALLMKVPEPLRATDLANALNVSNAALSKHVNKLGALELLVCSPCLDDKRTKLLTITEAGKVKVEQIGRELEEHGRFAAHFRRLSAEDQKHLDRIASLLHMQMSRDFLPVTRGRSLRG